MNRRMADRRYFQAMCFAILLVCSAFSACAPEQQSSAVKNITPDRPATVIAASGGHTCARLADTTVQCWGLNDKGQLGNGTTANSSVPVVVNGISNATVVTTGGFHSCVLLQDHTLRCWGDNTFGQLGIGP